MFIRQRNSVAACSVPGIGSVSDFDWGNDVGGYLIFSKWCESTMRNGAASSLFLHTLTQRVYYSCPSGSRGPLNPSARRRSVGTVCVGGCVDDTGAADAPQIALKWTSCYGVLGGPQLCEWPL